MMINVMTMESLELALLESFKTNPLIPADLVVTCVETSLQAIEASVFTPLGSEQNSIQRVLN